MRKTIAAALMSMGALGAIALPLPSAAEITSVRHNGWGYQHYQPSRWDRDGDGIPNRRDRTPDGYGPRWDRDNDGISNRHDPTPNGAVRFRDRDGDGVPNRVDRYPNNRYWY